MAKKRSVKPRAGQAQNQFRWPLLASLSAGLLAMLLALATFWPADSVAVEMGEAIYFCGLAIVAAILAWLAIPIPGAGLTSLRSGSLSLRGWGIDLAAWGLALWVGVSLYALQDVLNLRAAVNEWWLWVAGAACFTSARRLFAAGSAQRTIVLLVILSACLLAVHGWHQLLVSFPADRAQYAMDPDGVLKMVGIEAPPGSAQRMNFENRLRDGGPIATFALSNTLAGLLVPALLLTLGILVGEWRRLAMRERFGFAIAAFLIGTLLLRTNSRSAVLAVLIVAVAWGIYSVLSRVGGKPASDNKSAPQAFAVPWKGILAATVVVGSLLVAYVASNREIMERATASVAFRMQYWRGTISLVQQSPWFGCGPGNFQSAYENVRAMDASEQVAEPHNLWMETAAAGGIPAMLLLVVLVVLCVYWVFVGSRAPQALQSSAEPDSLPLVGQPALAVVDGRPLLVGYGCGVLVVWFLGALIGRFPDIDAQLWGWPLGALVVALVWNWLGKGTLPRNALIGAVSGVLIHWMLSSGWTIPGAAIPFWLLAGGLLAGNSVEPDQGLERDSEKRPQRSLVFYRLRWTVGAVGLGMLVAYFYSGMRPVTEAQRWSTEAITALRIDRAEANYRRAIEADVWDPALEVALADLYRQVLMAESNKTLRERFTAATEAAANKAPRDPSLISRLAAMYLHLYQRWGEPADLQEAKQLYLRAAELAPVSERLAAQIAVILMAEQDPQAAEWKERAETLAAAGGHIERELTRVNILSVEILSEAVQAKPQQKTAAELLKS